jgi:hypothetical protein
MRRFVLRAAAVALALLGTTSAANATWLVSGNAQLNNGAPTAQGVVNYAVYQNGGSFASLGAELTSLGITGLTNPGAANPTVDLSGAATTYLYFYQVVNNQSSSSGGTLELLFLSLVPQDVVAAGSATNNLTFNTAGGTAVGTGNLDSSGSGAINTTTPFVSGSPAGSWAGNVNNPPGFAFAGAGTTSGIGGGQYTNIMVIASNVAPVMGTGTLVDGLAPNSSGLVPVPAPEPGTLALLGLGLPLLGWGYARRLRASKALAAAAQ